VNWFERGLAAVAPQTALRRSQARITIARLSRVEDQVAKRSKRRYAGDLDRDRDWNINTGRVRGAMPLRQYDRLRIRRLVTKNPYAAKALQTLLNNLVGYGITGTPKKGVPKKVSDSWAAWIKRADWIGQLDFYGLQDLAIGTMLVDAESFIVRRFEKGAVIPTRLQILDGGMLASGLGNGGNGIDYDADGRPTKYHFRPVRGLGALTTISNVVSFDAKDVIHLFRREFVGQMHGRSLFEPVIDRLQDLDDYFDAEVVRKKIEACFAAFITPSAEYAMENPVAGAETEDQTDLGFDIEAFEPGMIERLRPGDDVKFGEPKAVADIREFTRAVLLGTTAGVGVPYEQGTGDLSNVNYSSYRAGSLEFQRFCGRLQWLLIIPMMLDRIWEWFLEDGYQTGVFAKRDYAIEWTPAAFESVDPKKEAEGRAAEMDAGLISRRRLVGERGYNYEQEMEQRAADDAFEAGLGLKFGQRQAATDAADGDAVAADKEKKGG